MARHLTTSTHWSCRNCMRKRNPLPTLIYWTRPYGRATRICCECGLATTWGQEFYTPPARFVCFRNITGMKAGEPCEVTLDPNAHTVAARTMAARR